MPVVLASVLGLLRYLRDYLSLIFLFPVHLQTSSLSPHPATCARGSSLMQAKTIASRLEAIALRLEAIALRLEAIALRLEAIAPRLEAIASR